MLPSSEKGLTQWVKYVSVQELAQKSAIWT